MSLTTAQAQVGAWTRVVHEPNGWKRMGIMRARNCMRIQRELRGWRAWHVVRGLPGYPTISERFRTLREAKDFCERTDP